MIYFIGSAGLTPMPHIFYLGTSVGEAAENNTDIREISESPVLVVALGLPPSPALLLHCAVAVSWTKTE